MDTSIFQNNNTPVYREVGILEMLVDCPTALRSLNISSKLPEFNL